MAVMEPGNDCWAFGKLRLKLVLPTLPSNNVTAVQLFHWHNKTFNLWVGQHWSHKGKPVWECTTTEPGMEEISAAMANLLI